MMLKVEKAHIRFPKVEIRADFKINPEERGFLMGPSGCGKSTILRWIAGFLELRDARESGQLWLGDRSLKGLPPEKRQIGFVTQDAHLFPALNVVENAALGLVLRGSDRRSAHAVAESALVRAGLKDRLQASVQTLSGGERSRVAFVRALVWRPQLMLLDEPFAALDAATKESLQSMLLDWHRELSIPWLMVTHDPNDLRTLRADRLFVFHLKSPGVFELGEAVISR